MGNLISLGTVAFTTTGDTNTGGLDTYNFTPSSTASNYIQTVLNSGGILRVVVTEDATTPNVSATWGGFSDTSVAAPSLSIGSQETFVAPAVTAITPASADVLAGHSVTIKATVTGTLPKYFWYMETDTTTNLIPSATTNTLTLANVTGATAGSYQLIVSNSSGMATSAVVSLTVADPAILIQPAGSYGLLDGTVQFEVTAAGSGLSYQWYQFDGSSTYTPPQQRHAGFRLHGFRRDFADARHLGPAGVRSD